MSLLQILYTDHKFLRSVTYRQVLLYITVFAARLRNILNTSRRYLEYMWTRTVWLDDTSCKSLEDIFARRLEVVLKTFCKTSWRVLKTSWKRLSKMSWRWLEDVLKTFWRCLEDVLKTSWRRMIKMNMLVLIKTSWRHLEDVFLRRMSKANIFVLIKTSWSRLLKTKMKDAFKTSPRRLHQDDCLLGNFLRLKKN